MKTRTKKMLGFGAVILMVSLMLVPMTAVAYRRPPHVVDVDTVLRGNSKFVFTYYSNGSVFVQEYVNLLGRIHGGKTYGYDYKLVGSSWIYPNDYPFKPKNDFFGLPPHTLAPII